jgi:hypothetical protein
MNLPSKIVLGSSSLYFTDKVFDGVRQHVLEDFFGASGWFADIVFAAAFAAGLGLAWVILHFCIKCAKRFINSHSKR